MDEYPTDYYKDEYGVCNDVITRLLGEKWNSWRKRHVRIRGGMKGAASAIRDPCPCPEIWKDTEDAWNEGVEYGYALRVGAIVLFIMAIGTAAWLQLMGAGL